MGAKAVKMKGLPYEPGVCRKAHDRPRSSTLHRHIMNFLYWVSSALENPRCVQAHTACHDAPYPPLLAYDLPFTMDANPPRVQLSCEQCQRRKTKCDKTTPCCACRKAGLHCTSVQRHRLPRGRSGNSRANASVNAALKDRVNKLEAAVQRLQRKEPAALPSRAEDYDGFVASGFWDELMDAVGGLRDVLADPDEEPNEPSLVPSPESASSGTWSTGEAAGLLLGANSSSLPAQALRPSPQERKWLQNLYRDRVDVIFKVLHWPTACSMIDYKTPTQPTAEVEALEYAIYFAAMCTTSSFEVDDRDSKIGQFRLATEAALIHANLLTTKSLTTLQAFVLYLVSMPDHHAKIASPDLSE
nr:c6 finger domain transcription factor nscr [Quercus suber]